MSACNKQTSCIFLILLCLMTIMRCDSGTATLDVIDLQVDKSHCKASCAVSRVAIYLMQETAGKVCMIAWGTSSSNGTFSLKTPLKSGTQVKIVLLATCNDDSCLRCRAESSVEISGYQSYPLSLETVSSCDAAMDFPEPCTPCSPTADAYCIGTRLARCSNSGNPMIEACPNGCQNNMCVQCTKKLYYKDSDQDAYGDPESSVEACSMPTGYVQNDDDCDDTNKAAHPGQTQYFTTPRANSSFDYNCDEKEEKQFKVIEDCEWMPGNGECTGSGYTYQVPACGRQGHFITCKPYPFSPMVCDSEPGTRIQPCR